MTRPRLADLAEVVGICLTTTVALIILIDNGQGLTFFFDEWNFLVGRELSIDGLLAPHNGHLSTLPVLVYLSLKETVGVSSYEPFQTLGFLTHGVTVAIAYFIIRERSRVAAVAVAPLLILLGSGWQNIMWPFQIGMMGSLAFGLLALREITQPTPRLRLLTWLTMSLLCAGGGVAVLGTSLLILILRRQWSLVGYSFLVAVLYGLWFGFYGSSQSEPGNISRLPGYVHDSLQATVRGAFGNLEIPAFIVWVLTIAIVAVCFRLRNSEEVFLPMAFMSLLMITWILTGASRAHLNEPGASRYVYVSGIVALTLFGISVTRKALPVMVVATVLWILVLPSGVRVLEQGSGGLRDASFHVRASLFVLDTYSERPSTDFPIEPNRAPQLSAFSYDRLARKYGPIGFSDDEISQLADNYRGTIDDTLMRNGTYRVQPATQTCSENEESVSNKFEMNGRQRVVLKPAKDTDVFMRRYSSAAALSLSMQLRGGLAYEIIDHGAVIGPPLTIEFSGSTVQVCPKSLSP